MIKQALRKLSYAVLPRRCDLCGCVVMPDEERCESCLAIPRIEGDICPECGKSSECCKCSARSGDKPDYDGVSAPFLYEGSIVSAIHSFKFGGFSELSTAFASEMAGAIHNAFGDIRFDAIVYIPMSKRRERRRGYNQSRLLACELSELLSIPIEDAFYKAYDAPPQRGLSAEERRASIFAAFDINEGIEPQGKTYLIVDDVKTTGSTLSECAAVLKAYGADRVYACTIAIR